MTSCDVSRARTSRARARTSSMTSQSHQFHQSLNLNLVVVAVAMGLSWKPHGRFSSFFARRLVWMSLPHVAKIIMIGLIFMDLEGFCITMATVLDFSKILFPPDITGPTLHMHVRFCSDPSRNNNGVRARGHKPYCFYCMIRPTILSSTKPSFFW